MSERTRIKRPTYRTPRKGPTGVMVHCSTNYGWLQPRDALGRVLVGQPATFVKLTRGVTYRRAA